MATAIEPRDRLQPALLDRLTDNAPTASSEADERRVMSKAALRQAVIRDLGWLFNATQPLRAACGELVGRRVVPWTAGALIHLAGSDYPHQPLVVVIARGELA